MWKDVELRQYRHGGRTLSAIRTDYVAGSAKPPDFAVLIFDEEEGYTFSETFKTELEALRRYDEKLSELLGAGRPADAQKR